MKIVVNRTNYYKDTTTGEMDIDDDFFAYTLEDCARPEGVKVNKHTCIPTGIYNIEVTYSNRFKRDMVLISNTPDKAVENDGVRFTGVRVHGGNTHENTEGCILVAANVNEDTIYGSMEKEFTARVQEALARGEEVAMVVY